MFENRGEGEYLGLNGSSWTIIGEECIARSCMINIVHHMSLGVYNQKECDGRDM